MSISFNCTCGKPLKSKEEMAGRKTKCPHCGAILTIPGTPARTATATATAARADSAISAHPDAMKVEGLDWMSPDASAIEKTVEPTAIGPATASGSGSVSVPASDSLRRPDLPRPDDGSKQYKVLGQRDHSASGKINFASLEATLNEQAHHGWVMKSAFVVSMPGHAGNHDEVVLILER
jgi:hypothetical protein